MSKSPNPNGSPYGSYREIEEYHRNYYRGNPERYLKYRIRSAIKLLQANGYKVIAPDSAPSEEPAHE